MEHTHTHHTTHMQIHIHTQGTQINTNKHSHNRDAHTHTFVPTIHVRPYHTDTHTISNTHNVCMHVTATEDNFWQLTLAFHHLGPGDQASLFSEHFAGPSDFFLRWGSHVVQAILKPDKS